MHNAPRYPRSPAAPVPSTASPRCHPPRICFAYPRRDAPRRVAAPAVWALPYPMASRPLLPPQGRVQEAEILDKREVSISQGSADVAAVSHVGNDNLVSQFDG